MDQRRSGVPNTDRRLLVLAGICLAIPIIALLWVGSYNQEKPRLGGIPFFFWYQFCWVFLTSALTYSAHRLVIAARRQGPGPARHEHDHAPPTEPSGDGDNLRPLPGFRT